MIFYTFLFEKESQKEVLKLLINPLFTQFLESNNFLLQEMNCNDHFEISKESLTINQKRSFSYRSLTFFTNFQINVGKTIQCNLFFHVISIISVVFVIYNVISISVIYIHWISGYTLLSI